MKSEVMKTPRIEGEYRCPKAKVIEVQPCQAILQNSGGNESPKEEDWGDL